MRRFDSRRQEDNETIPDFEQALRTLHRERLGLLLLLNRGMQH